MTAYDSSSGAALWPRKCVRGFGPEIWRHIREPARWPQFSLLALSIFGGFVCYGLSVTYCDGLALAAGVPVTGIIVDGQHNPHPKNAKGPCG